MSNVRPSQRVMEAIQEAVQQAGGMHTAHVAVVEFIDDEGKRSWCTSVGETQGYAATLGLLRFHQLDVERQAWNHLNEDEE